MLKFVGYIPFIYFEAICQRDYSIIIWHFFLQIWPPPPLYDGILTLRYPPA